jgi:predicted flap endonuclease-1-like 5' DNA nuclease
MASILDIEGVGEAQATKLRDAGVGTVEALLERGATSKGRDDLAAATGISGRLILKWVNHADLFRIKGVAGEYAELLEAAGVDTVAELAQRNAANLAQALEERNQARKIVRRVPTESQVSDWIAEAKRLPRKVTY